MNAQSILKTALSNASTAGAIRSEQYAQATRLLNAMTAQQHEALLALAAIDWSQILKLLPLLATLIPGIGPLIPIITTLLPFILELINGGVTPGPTPGPTPNPGPIPTPT